MSDEPQPQSIPPPASDSVSLPVDPPAAPLKPLLNPLQTNDTPQGSTIAEPPRSPNPLNTATDERGNNAELDLPSASGSVVGPGDVGSDTTPVVEASTVPVASVVPETAEPSSEIPAPVADTTQPPLPKDATPPPPPEPKDEVPPVLPPNAIPSAVPTPSVITVEDPLTAAAVPPPSDQTPAPSSQLGPTSSDQVDAGLTATPGTVHANGGVHSDAMDVDAAGEDEEVEPQGLSGSASTSSLKRSGEELNGVEPKRIKEDSKPAQLPDPSLQAAAPAPPPTPAQPVPAQPQVAIDPNAPPPPWLTYTPPAPQPSGPSTPLTATQHRHLLSSVRALKKNKEAINFLLPVDVVRFGIPHYANIIDKPMDLGTVEQKLIVSDPRGPPKDKSKMKSWDPSKGSYGSVSEVVQDVRQIWENTRKFNGPDHLVTQQAKKLEEVFEKMVKNIPAEPLAPPTAPIATPSPAPVAGPSSTSARRASISQPPVIRRTSDGTDTRPKREIHPPPSKDLAYADVPGGGRKPKRRNDPQLQWVARTIKNFEQTQKHYSVIAPFLYPVEDIIASLPNYSQIVKKPIDMLHIKRKLEEGDYDEVAQVDQDVKLMIKNALVFNQPGEPVHDAATQFKQLWEEKWRTLPAKQEARDTSEDPLGDEYFDESDGEDSARIQKVKNQIADLQSQLADLEAKHAKKRAAAKSRKSKPPKGARKQSMQKMSPGLNGNGNGSGPKKGRKSKDYREDDGDESEEDSGTVTLSQKQELAEKIQLADGETLNKAIEIITTTTSLGAKDEEIELDIDSLPPRTIQKLYTLVCRGGRKSGSGKARKTGKKQGGSRRRVNEEEEAKRIQQMQAQLESFGGRPSGPGYDGEDSDSSEEESSDED